MICICLARGEVDIALRLDDQPAAAAGDAVLGRPRPLEPLQDVPQVFHETVGAEREAEFKKLIRQAVAWSFKAVVKSAEVAEEVYPDT